MGVLAADAFAQDRTPPRHVDVIEVNGFVDSVTLDFLGSALDDAAEGGAEALVIQMDSTGEVASTRRLDVAVFRIAHAAVPVAVWVGGTGSPRASGDALRLFNAAAVTGVGPGGRIAGLRAADAVERGVADVSAPTLGDFIVALDGRASINIPSEIVRREGRDPQRRPLVALRFAKPGFVARMLHAVTSPSTAYILLVTGLILIIFEFFSAGIGIAGVTGAAALVLSAYGLGALPTRPWALALIALGMIGFAIDLQAGAPRTWTAIGTAALAIGSVGLFDGVDLPLATAAIGVAGTALAVVAGIPSMIRARFSTPTIGRESMVGELGTATADVAPEGTVEVQGAPWKARTNRATPITRGDRVRVVGIDGLLLEVEPETGGAKEFPH